MNPIHYRDDPDSARALLLAQRTGQEAARVDEFARQLAAAFASETPRRAEELARVSRDAALLSPAALERLVASVPGIEPARVREALRAPRPETSAPSAPEDAIERAPELGPFASGPAVASVAAADDEGVSVASLEAASRGDLQAAEAGSRSQALIHPIDDDRVAAGAAATYAGEPAVPASWLAEREAVLVAIRGDYEAARARALATPGEGPGWLASFPLYDGEGGISSANRAVWVPDPDNPREIVGWSEGDPIYRDVGRWVEFSEESFAAHYRASGGELLQRLAAVYDPSGRTDAAALLAAHPELWGIATSDHALNAGPPLEGSAMGDAGQLGMLDLYLADPQIAALVESYGGDPAPATGGIALEQVRLLGEQRYEQLTRLSNAMASVRTQYTDALARAQQAGDGPGWVERTVNTMQYVEVGESGAYQPALTTQQLFDRDAFTNWYIAQDGPQHQAFGAFYGRSHTTASEQEIGESGFKTTEYSTTFDNPNWTMSGSAARTPSQGMYMDVWKNPLYRATAWSLISTSRLMM